MAHKPVIAYIDTSDTGVVEHSDQHALCYFLRQELGFEVFTFEYYFDFRDERRLMKVFADAEVLQLVIVREVEWLNQHQEVIAFVRANLSQTVPIVVISDTSDICIEDERTHVYYYTNTAFVRLLESLIASYRPPVDWLGTKTEKDRSLLIRQLSRAYQIHYLADDEDVLVASDWNHQVVAEALRIKLLPAECLAEEFDSTLEESAYEYASVDLVVYAREVERIRSLSDNERDRLRFFLWEASSHLEGSCGDGVHGFAIDSQTFQMVVTTRFGQHRAAKQLLIGRLFVTAQLSLEHRNGSRFIESDEDRYVLSGFVFFRLSSVVPLVALYAHDVDPEVMRKIASFIMSERKYILVAFDGNLIEP